MGVSDSNYVLNVIGTIMVVIDFEEVISSATLYTNCFIKIPLGSGEVILPFVKGPLFGGYGSIKRRHGGHQVVCLILSMETGKFYTSITSSLIAFIQRHRWLLKANRHTNSNLQKEFLEFGPDLYLAMCIFVQDQPLACSVEQFFIDYGSIANKNFNTTGSKLDFSDLTNRQFDYWKVIARAPNVGTATYWYCQCACGTKKPVQAKHLTSGASKSCGCRPADIKTHGETRGGILRKKYRTWRYIRNRCLNPDNKDADIYFGLLCDEWLVYENFDRDVPDPPDDKYSIDRIKNEDNHG
jgi:hypothetical protein